MLLIKVKDKRERRKVINGERDEWGHELHGIWPRLGNT